MMRFSGSASIPKPLLEIPRNLRADRFSNRDGNSIPDHSVGVRVASRESKCQGHPVSRLSRLCLTPFAGIVLRK